MGDFAASLISGLTGVFVGAIIQIIYEYNASKKQKREECKKDCINEWLQFRNEIKNYFENKNERNNIYFRESYMIKTVLLKSIANSKDSKHRINNLIEKLLKKDEQISLNGVAEEALQINSTPEQQIKFELEMFNVIYDTIRVIQNI